MANMQRLQTEWAQLLDSLGFSPAVAGQEFARLAEQYLHPDRHYHTMDHIQSVLKVVGLLADSATNLPAILLAAWLHDVIYDPRRGDNEERSAAYAAGMLQQGPGGHLIETVSKLILATRDHRPSDLDCQILLDADLAILGAPAPDYLRYAQAIRQEYSWVAEAKYRSGRTAILQAFLQRPCIFGTSRMQAEREGAARRNLEWEIARLASGN